MHRPPVRLLLLLLLLLVLLLLLLPLLVLLLLLLPELVLLLLREEGAGEGEASGLADAGRRGSGLQRTCPR